MTVALLGSGPMRGAAMALLLAAATQACSAFHASSTDGIPPGDIPVRVRSDAPFPLRSTAPAAAAVVLCHASLIEGPVRSAIADTIVVELLGRVTQAADPDGGRRDCPTRGEVLVVRTATTTVTSSQPDGRRTAMLVLAVVAVVVVLAGFGAVAASRMLAGWSTEDGWGTAP